MFRKKAISPEILYQKVLAAIGEKTPLEADCGYLCDHACCKGDAASGMELFPKEPSTLPLIESDGIRLAVCGGSCDRNKRPLACRIFPFFPVVDEKGHVSVELDPRAMFLCPIAAHAEMVAFDKSFLRSLKKAGKLLITDPEIKEYMARISEEIRAMQTLLD